MAKRSITETIEYFEYLSRGFEVEARKAENENDSVEAVACYRGKAEAYKIAAFELKRNMETVEEAVARIKREDTMTDIRTYAQDHGLELDEETVAAAEQWLNGSCKADCNLSYWDNVAFAVEHARGLE